MDKQAFRQRVEQEIIILDGVFGTMLQPHLPPGSSVDAANIEKPDLVRGVLTGYVEAGTDILSTNSFGASRIRLKEFGLDSKTRDINYRAAQMAREVAGEGNWVAGVVGPTGKLVEPLGELSFDEAYDAFREQASALAEGGVDLFLLETFSDIKEIKIAVIAIKENTGLPIMAAMTFDENFTCFTGTDPVTAANVLDSLGVDAIGVNCSTGPGPMLEIVGRFAQTTELPLFVEPNAGIPRLNEKTKTIMYRVSPGEMADFGEKFIQIGANIIGSCCGSTPEYTAELRKRLKGKKPLSRKVSPVLRLSSRVRTVEIGSDLPFCVIGERINPTNRENLATEIQDGKIGFIQKEAQEQAASGAHVLDVNIGIPNIDEAAYIGRVVRGIENVTDSPLSIDSVNSQAVEAALRESAGKVLINSVNGEEKSMERILPKAGRYGAGVLCLAVDEEGIPKTPEARLAVLKKIIQRAEEMGISRKNLICDCLTLTVSAQQKRVHTTLNAIRMVKEELGLPTVLGVSNISYGLPERSLINATFLSMAMASGLDAAIMNPGDRRIMETVRAASVLTVRDRDSQEFVKSHAKKKKVREKPEDKRPEDKEEHAIFNAVINGNRDEIGALVEEALASGSSALDINNHLLIPAIEEVGRKYDRKEIYLPQMILAAETMQRAFILLEPYFEKGDVREQGRIVLCTVKGDVHDIGKNIVGLFLRNQGLHVIDLGKDVSKETIVQETLKQKADVVGLSALMTTTMTEIPEIIQALREAGSKAKVVVGGAVVTKKYAKEIGADGYAKDGVEAVDVVKKLVGEKVAVE